MKYKFDDRIKVHMPASCLIEDIQSLRRAIDNDSKELAESVLECLMEALDSYAVLPEGVYLEPSASSLIAPSHVNGILVQENGDDIPCAAGQPVSAAMQGGCLQCPDECPYLVDGECNPEKGMICLSEDFTYDGSTIFDGDRLLEFLDKA